MRRIAVTGLAGLALALAACGDSAKQPAPKVGIITVAHAAAEAKGDPANEAKHEVPEHARNARDGGLFQG